MGDGSNTSQLIDPINIFGKGDYQLEIKIGDKSFKYPGVVHMNDYFDYQMKLTDPIAQSSSVGCGFTLNNKLYIPQQSGKMSIVDLGTGNVRSKPGYYNYDHQPVFLANKVYMNIYKEDLMRYALCSFNEATEEWDELNMDGVLTDFSLKGLGVFNNQLLIISSKGDVYKFDQKWILLNNIKLNLYFIHYIHSIYGNLYLCDFYQGNIIVVSTSDWTILKLIKMPGIYENSLRYIFDKEGTMFFCAKPGGGVEDQYNFFKFTAEEKFEALIPKKMVFDFNYHFCPDGKGNIFFINKEYVYKFNQ